MLAPGIPADLARFAIGFDQRDRERVHALWERIFDSNQWSEGELTRQFETAWAAILVASILGIAFYAALAVAERFVLSWHPAVKSRVE